MVKIRHMIELESSLIFRTLTIGLHMATAVASAAVQFFSRAVDEAELVVSRTATPFGEHFHNAPAR